MCAAWSGVPLAWKACRSPVLGFLPGVPRPWRGSGGGGEGRGGGGAEFWGGVQAAPLVGNVSPLLVGQSVSSPVKWKY